MKSVPSLLFGFSASRSGRCMLVVLALCAFPLLASAQHKPVTTDELTQQADLIVVGKVAGLKAGWNTDRSRIITTVTLAVDQTLKGDAGTGSVTILVPGGEVDGVGELYSHTAQFKKDEEVVVFAKKDKQGRLRTTGGENGKLSIRKDAASGISLVSGETALDEFTANVRNAAGSQKK
jgi:hypothetical protein